MPGRGADVLPSGSPRRDDSSLPWAWRVQPSAGSMFIGHYGAAYAIKRWRPDISLFALFLAVQVLDVAWSVFVMLGIEKVRIVPGFTRTNPLDLYYMPYTHSLVGALVWALACAAIYVLALRRAAVAGVALGVAVFSHWVFDLVVHRADLALYDNTAKVGLGLWNFPLLAFSLEIALVLGGLALYLSGRRSLDRIGRYGPWVFCTLLIAVQTMVFFGGAIGSPDQAAVIALVSYFGFAAIAQWLDRHEGGRAPRGLATAVPT